MFIEFRDEKDRFRSEYLKLLGARMSYSSLRLEAGAEDGDVLDTNDAMKFYGNMKAMEYLFNQNEDEKLRPDVIQTVADLVTDGEFQHGYRKGVAIVEGSNVERSKPRDIAFHMYALLDSYYNIWEGLDIYEKEAMFHIRFSHIHPFEDGNGRTARAITAYHLAKQDLAPVIIPRDLKRQYCDYIETGDVKGLANLFETLSKQELDVMVNLYQKLDKQEPLTPLPNEKIKR